MHTDATTDEPTSATWVQFLDKKLYPGVDKNWDDDLFRTVILNELRPDDRLLDLGAGAGIVPQMDFLGRASQVCGVDPDPRVVDNPCLDEGLVGVGEEIPYPDESFDVVLADNVLEHLDNPVQVFQEVARVLKPGGRFFTKTPNKRHYMPMIARMTPLGFHRFYNRLRGRAGEDTFPTLYRVNTRTDQARIGREAGLSLVDCRLVEGRPEYLRISVPTYLLGAAYERIVNSMDGLSSLRVLLVSTFEKQAQPLSAVAA